MKDNKKTGIHEYKMECQSSETISVTFTVDIQNDKATTNQEILQNFAVLCHKAYLELADKIKNTL